MYFDFANVLAFFAIAIGFVLVSLLAGNLLRPARHEARKGLGYECGEEPIHKAWFNFNPRFYIIALIFLIFDVELAFMYPVAAVFQSWVASGNGGIVLLEIFLFVGILVVGLAYVWIKGDLDWIKRLRVSKTQGPDGPRETL